MAVTEFSCEVQSFRMLTPTVFELAFTTENPLEFKGGQFVSVVVPGAGPGGRDLRRAYSIASAPHQRPIELCVKLVEGGPGTNYLYKLRKGDRFRGFAPYGDFLHETPEGRRTCFIATGTGIAPFRSMLLASDFWARPPKSVHCLLGVREEDELLYDSEMRAISGLEWVPAVSQPKGNWSGYRGRVTQYLREQGDRFPWLETEFYLCGAGAMIDEIKKLLQERGVAKESIHQEVYYKPPKNAAPAAS